MPDGWNDIGTLVGGVSASVAAIVAVVIAVQLDARERRQALASVHVDLTTGDTARARDIIGQVLYSKKGLKAVDRDAAISAFFRLYWAVQRLENAYLVYRITTKRARWQGLHETFLTYHFNEIAFEVAEFRRRHKQALEIADNDAWVVFRSTLASYPQAFSKAFPDEVDGDLLADPAQRSGK